MTIPTLMTKIQHKQYTARLKKFYSTMSQMVISAQEEYGDVGSWEQTLPKKDYLERYFVPFLKGNVRTVGTSVYFDFLDGSNILVVTWSGSVCADIQYDVNGYSKPNKHGYDRFQFTFCPDSSRGCYGHGGFCPYGASSGTNREALLNRCKNENNACSALLKHDNWEFAKDYPLN